jgi:hypothetical protein
MSDTVQDYPYGRNAPHPTLEPPISKSWLFEIVETDTSRIVESFTLVMPPTSIQIKEAQRVSITKTFGNAFVDDYGPDNIQITLKAISGTVHTFPTFKPQGKSIMFNDTADALQTPRLAKSGYNGRDAFYVFRNTIMRYKDSDGWDKNELRVYDLADEQAYKCVLLDFTLDRNADNPLRYPFTISLFVYERLDKYKPKLKAIKIAENPTSALNTVDSLIDKIKELYKDIESISNKAALLSAKALELRTRYNRFLAQTTKILTSPLDIAKNFIDIGLTAVGVAYDTYRAGKYTLERYMYAEEMIRETLNKGLKIYGYQISEGWQVSRNVVIEGDGGINVSGTGNPTRDIITDTYTFSGLRVYTVKGQDTLQSIARNELGDEDYWPYVAFVNTDINTNDDLVAGNTIYLPVQVDPSEGINKEQFIITEDITRDPYGTDIRIDSDGNLVIQENGDFGLISGIDNIKQSIDLRLNTVAGSMLKQSAFGLSVGAGLAGTTMAIRYLKMALRATVIQDPRVESVDDIIVYLEKDTIYINMTIKIIGTSEVLSVESIL